MAVLYLPNGTDSKDDLMSAITFDTLAYAKKLKAVGVPSEQAEVQAETIAEVMDERMATKRDLDVLESNLKHDMVEIKRDIKALEVNLRHDMKAHELTVNLKIEQLRSDMIRWQIGTSVATVGILFALLRLAPVSPVS
jgi:hypothetical protein